ncbi:MAG: DUF1203 domain-containing protein [Bacteroidota bacterium]
MKHDFIISGIPLHALQHVLNLDKKDQDAQGITKIIVDKKPGYPCRVSLEDANIGEEILAFNYEHHTANSPYRSSGPVFVRLNANEARPKKNEIPKILEIRYLSLRAYDKSGMMIDAATTFGKDVKETIQQLFDNQHVQYIHVHNAKPGCYNCRIDRF